MLPPAPTAAVIAPTATAPVADAANVNANVTASSGNADANVTASNGNADAASAKQFAPAKQADGTDTPVPTIMGVDMNVLAADMYAFLVNKLKEKGVTDINAFAEKCDDTDKTKFPGSKAGRNAFRAMGVACDLLAINESASRRRGSAGTKEQIARRDATISKLTAIMGDLCAKMGIKLDDVLK